MPKAMYLSRTLLGCVVALGALLSATSVANADQKTLDKIEKMSQEAMERFTGFEYDKAAELLNDALNEATLKRLADHPLVAKVHVNLGIVLFTIDGADNPKRAQIEFAKAVQIDGGVEIDPLHATPEMRELFEKVRDEYGATEPVERVDCSSIAGLEHTIVDATPPGKDREFSAFVGDALGASKISLHYRMYGVDGASPDYKEVEMSRTKGCTYVATIPGADVKEGGVLHYYVAAYSDTGRTLESKGASGSPNIVDIVVGSGGDIDENPLKPEKPTGPSDARLFVAAKLGGGGAFITGITESLRVPVNCCLAPGPFQAELDVGYFVTPQLSLAAVFRLGIPIGANIDRHATAAPAGLVRLRFAFDPSGEGPTIMGAIGGGVIRQTVRVENAMDPMQDVDTTAIGPLLLGGGFAYTKGLSEFVRLAAEVNVTAGLPVINELGSARLNFGIQLDLNLGVAFLF